MKKMTCKQLGGPCETAFHGNKADEVIKAQDAHLKTSLLFPKTDLVIEAVMSATQVRCGG